MFAALALVFGLSACDGGNVGDSAGDAAATELGQCPNYDGCGDLCRNLEDDLTYISQEWTAEDAAYLDELCAVADGIAECQDCTPAFMPQILDRWAACGLCGLGFDDDAIQECSQYGQDGEFVESRLAHLHDSCFATCEFYGIPHDGDPVSSWKADLEECDAKIYPCLAGPTPTHTRDPGRPSCAPAAQTAIAAGAGTPRCAPDPRGSPQLGAYAGIVMV